MPNPANPRPALIRARRLAVGTVAAGLTAAGAATAFAGDIGPYPDRPPFTKRCGLEIRAYQDGSASLYCDGKVKPFAAIDPESGRIRFFAGR